MIEKLRGHPAYYRGGFKGRHSEETKHKISQAKKEGYQQGKYTSPNKGKSPSIELRNKISAGVKRAWEEGRLSKVPPKLSEISPLLWRDKLSKGVETAWAEGKRTFAGDRAKIADGVHQAWLRGELRGYPHREETKQLLSLRTRQAYMEGKLPPKPQTKLERDLERILECNFPGEWRYVGDGKVTIEGYRPDFINCNGKKLVIEAYGNFWHKPEEEDKRKELFAKYGYRTLVIWEPEDRKLREEDVVSTVKAFMTGGATLLGGL